MLGPIAVFPVCELSDSVAERPPAGCDPSLELDDGVLFDARFVAVVVVVEPPA